MRDLRMASDRFLFFLFCLLFSSFAFLMLARSEHVHHSFEAVLLVIRIRDKAEKHTYTPSSFGQALRHSLVPMQSCSHRPISVHQRLISLDGLGGKSMGPSVHLSSHLADRWICQGTIELQCKLPPRHIQLELRHL